MGQTNATNAKRNAIDIATTAIHDAHKELGPEADHEDCVYIMARKLRSAGLKVMQEKILPYPAGFEGKPDITIVDTNGENLCHIEIKCKNHVGQDGRAQARKFFNAEGGRVPVILVNMKGSKPGPNIIVME